MAKMEFAEWLGTQSDVPGGDNSYDDAPFRARYKDYVESYVEGGTGTSIKNLFTQYKIDLEAQNKDNQVLRPGIKPYDGYQAPDYGKTTPNNTHWLNTMNAFAPTARNDMERLLGQGGGNTSNGMPGTGIQTSAERANSIANLNGQGIARTPYLPAPRGTGTQTPAIDPQTSDYLTKQTYNTFPEAAPYTKPTYQTKLPPAPTNTNVLNPLQEFQKAGYQNQTSGPSGAITNSEYWTQPNYNTFPEADQYQSPYPTFADLYSGKTTAGLLTSQVGADGYYLGAGLLNGTKP